MCARWYELTPEICMTISKIELTPIEERVRYAKMLLLELKKEGCKIDKAKYLRNMQSYKMGRWYDKNRYLFLAFEVLKDSTPETQHKVTTKMLDILSLEKAA